MPRRFDLLVFDWDGTLMDSARCIAESLQAACRDTGHAVPSDRDARYVIGLGLNDAMAHVLPGVAPSAYASVVERYRHHFLLHDSGTTLFSGVAEMLQHLRA
jgi:phosphoglycolate phosphatase